jgi:hypothetical protein
MKTPKKRTPPPPEDVEAAIAEGLEALRQGRVIGPFASMEEYKAFRTALIAKRHVEPSEFVPHKTKLKGPLTRLLAYEE